MDLEKELETESEPMIKNESAPEPEAVVEDEFEPEFDIVFEDDPELDGDAAMDDAFALEDGAEPEEEAEPELEIKYDNVKSSAEEYVFPEEPSPVSEKKKQPRKRSRAPLIALICVLVCVLALSVAVLMWFVSGSNIQEYVTVEAGSQTINPNDHLKIRWIDSASYVSDLSTLNINKPGDYPVQILFCNNVYDSVIRVADTVAPTAVTKDVAVIAVHPPVAEDFIAEVKDASQVTVAFAQEPDMTVAGEQTVSIALTDEGGNTVTVRATLNVTIDTQAPVIEGIADLQTYKGQPLDYLQGVTITDDLDAAPVLEVDDSQVDMEQGGTYPLTYTGTDESGNVNTQTVNVTVIVDENAPTIYGVQTISIYAGSTVSYRSGVMLEDDIDENPKLAIDSSKVDLSTPGTYEVTYIATDAAGNESTATATVKVAEKKSSYVEEDVIFAKADEILAKIITADMTNAQKVKAIYDYVVKNYSYTSYADKTDVYQAAYKMMTKRSGNCFSYYAVSKLFFDRLNMPNLMVTRKYNIYRPYNHYWNMVSIDGGETYYHYDATPRKPSMSDRYLMTDADLARFDSKYIRGYYTRDLDLYPTTPEEKPEV